MRICNVFFLVLLFVVVFTSVAMADARDEYRAANEALSQCLEGCISNISQTDAGRLKAQLCRERKCRAQQENVKKALMKLCENNESKCNACYEQQRSDMNQCAAKQLSDTENMRCQMEAAKRLDQCLLWL